MCELTYVRWILSCLTAAIVFAFFVFALNFSPSLHTKRHSAWARIFTIYNLYSFFWRKKLFISTSERLLWQYFGAYDEGRHSLKRDMKKNATVMARRKHSQPSQVTNIEGVMDSCFCIGLSQRLCRTAGGSVRAEVQLFRNVTAAWGYKVHRHGGHDDWFDWVRLSRFVFSPAEIVR